MEGIFQVRLVQLKFSVAIYGCAHFCACVCVCVWGGGGGYIYVYVHTVCTCVLCVHVCTCPYVSSYARHTFLMVILYVYVCLYHCSVYQFRRLYFMQFHCMPMLKL